MRTLRTAAAALLMASITTVPGTRPLSAGEREVTGILPSGYGKDVDRAIEKVRTATKEFRSLDRAAKAGYTREIAHCIANPPDGAMGYHHDNPSLVDATLEVERPEILVYERLPGGEYRLNGVEYIVPLKAWDREQPPQIMGQSLKRADSLGIWYLHVWVWQANPNGVFADWNPTVRCQGT